MSTDVEFQTTKPAKPKAQHADKRFAEAPKVFGEREPKASCHKCYGRGWVGLDDKNKPRKCSCVNR